MFLAGRSSCPQVYVEGIYLRYGDSWFLVRDYACLQEVEAKPSPKETHYAAVVFASLIIDVELQPDLHVYCV